MAPPTSHSFRFDKSLDAPAPPSEPALDLTASDGTGLRLVSLTARVVLDDPLAFTELQLVFENPEPRALEGRFRITLPAGASVSRFAMRQGDRWQEGEVVERQAARRAYEDFLHRAQDPALLEHESGNEFSARVFPIEARGRKELILSYGHELAQTDAPYRLPLVGLPRLDSLDVRALVASAEAAPLTSSLGGATRGYQVVEVRKELWKPDADFEVQPPTSPRSGLRSGDLVLVRVQPPLPTEPEEIPSLLILLDTSASRSLGHARQVETVLALARALSAGSGPDAPLAVACFDQTVRLVFEGPASGFGEAEAGAIEAGGAFGASDLGAALRWAATRPGPRYERALLVSDGVATAGQVEPEQLREAARALAAAGVRRLDALAAGGLRDDASLRRLVTAGLPRDGVVCDASLPLYAIGDRLTRATRSDIRVEVPGASWVWPPRLDAMQPGDAALVYADLPAGHPVEVRLDGAPVPRLDLAPCERPLLERAWVKARIERLESLSSDPATDRDVRAGLKKQIIDLSVQHRVLCTATALLVLETEADYARHGIDRRGLSDILTVGLGGLEVLHRSAAAPVLTITTPASPKGAVSKSDEGAPSKAKKTASRRESPAASGAPSPAPSPMDFLDREVSDGAPMPDLDDAPAEHDEAHDSFEEERSSNREDVASMSTGAAASEQAVSRAIDTSSLQEERRQESASQREQSESVARRSRASTSPAPASPMSPAAMAPPPAMSAPSPGALPLPPSSPMSASPAPQAGAPAPGGMPPSMRQTAAPAPTNPEPTSLLRRIADTVTEVFAPRPEAPAAAPLPAPPPAPPPAQVPARPAPATPPTQALVAGPWTGPFLEVMTALQQGDKAGALARARAWLEREPGNVLALVSLALVAEAAGDLELAARACGSLIDLYPSRADLRRFAGERLEKLSRRDALELAIDTYRKAVDSRPDHPSAHRLLGMALLRAGRPAEAFEVLAAAQARTFDSKFPGIERILAEDLGLAAAAWGRVEPARRDELQARLARAGATTENAPSVRFVLVWETDANDVDFHIHDARGGHAYYGSKVLPSGGELYADVTQGYGPECFTIRLDPKRRSYPYRLEAHYFRRGPMGYGMGTLQILEHDGHGRLAFEDRPYIVMEDGATVALGHVDAPLAFAD